MELTLNPVYVNDKATCVDGSLGTQSLVSKLSAEIKNSVPPKTFSITGYWGAGKTSALAMLFKTLTGAAPPIPLNNVDDTTESTEFIGIWFEAWRYQNEQQPIVALLQAIKQSFSTTDKFIDRTGKLASVSVLGALTVLDGVIKSATGMSGFSKIKQIGEEYEKEHLLSRLANDQINDALKQAIDTLVKSDSNDKKKLAIFIDDLDRCEPEAVHNLLEGLKLFLTIENCVVIMAIDSQQVEQSLIKKIGVEAASYQKFYGVEYLEKICQDSFRLPVPDASKRIDYVKNTLFSILNPLGLKQTQKIQDISSVLQKYECLPANPRRLKMLCNRIASLLLYVNTNKLKHLKKLKNDNGLNKNQFDELYALSVVIIGSLYVNYRRIYERLEQCPTFISELFNFCESTPSKDYDDPRSVFFEFYKPEIDTGVRVEHASDLAVFRLKKMFLSQGNSPLNEFNITQVGFGDILHELIVAYNTAI